MAEYLISTFYKLLFWSIITILYIVSCFIFIQKVWVGFFAICLIANTLWIGFYYIWNLATIEITIELIEWFFKVCPDEDFFTIPRILERKNNRRELISNDLSKSRRRGI